MTQQSKETKVRFDNLPQRKVLEDAAARRKWSLNRYLIECGLAIAKQPVPSLVVEPEQIQVTQ